MSFLVGASPSVAAAIWTREVASLTGCPFIFNLLEDISLASINLHNSSGHLGCSRPYMVFIKANTSQLTTVFLHKATARTKLSGLEMKDCSEDGVEKF